MKVVIFAGGKGTRISEKDSTIPKPMIRVGGKPILWHIMMLYKANGHNDFIICLGYLGDVIKEFFATESHDFNVTLVDTGVETYTGGRLKQIESYLTSEDENFMLTYGDGLSDVNINEVINFHKQQDKICTLTTIQPASRYGRVMVESDGSVSSFNEKPQEHETWINGGFFVLKKDVFKYLEGDMDVMMWERKPMESLVEAGEMVAFKHKGFWQCMDTPRDQSDLENLWVLDPKWKNW